MANPYPGFGNFSLLTPQSQPIPGREPEMVANNAGGFGFKLDDWDRLHRFLILGSEGGTYYVGEQKLTVENAAAAIRCIKADGVRAVNMAHAVNYGNRAPKTDQQLFLLALAMKHGDDATKQAVATSAPSMLRTGTHLLHFTAMLDSLGGWNRSKRRLVAKWFEDQEADKVAYQVLKYQQRDGWAMRDVLRVAHPKPPTETHRAVYEWTCGRKPEGLPEILADHQAMLLAIGAGEMTASEAALEGIRCRLPREALPTEALADPVVWRALLPQTPPHALFRNLGNLTASGVLTQGGKDASLVAERLVDREGLVRARVHPFAVLLASLVYQQGRGVRSDKTWTPVRQIIEALDDAYEAAFATVKPTGKRVLIGVDISNSMAQPCQGTPIATSKAAAAMALTLARAEPNATVVHFDVAVQRVVPITKRSALSSIEATNGGGTDLASPIRWALGEATGSMQVMNGWGHRQLYTPPTQLPPAREHFDAFIILTDNETWAGNGHASQYLDAYRKQINPKAKLICCSMAANHANIVDPNDAGSLGCAGLDANLPAIVAEFIGA